ncbi:hypothetical protein CWE09_06655 [Aliidiomarina minuta]|uniref:Uncharacterized protein n=1 Tax=Aliidiomarina minuta TaxID=880057 RepID=A0A432W8C5_9GAMM|nr:hypothetical protein [Aliidiomarina minuta]RUO26383.1 hypothetical protein CWE09_06655 [Aliidiomarina minuta]
MSDKLQQAEQLEEEFVRLSNAGDLDDQRIADILEQRDVLHRELLADIDNDSSLVPIYKPFLQQAYAHTQELQARCEEERADIKQRLITLNTSKKAHKVY